MVTTEPAVPSAAGAGHALVTAPAMTGLPERAVPAVDISPAQRAVNVNRGTMAPRAPVSARALETATAMAFAVMVPADREPVSAIPDLPVRLAIPVRVIASAKAVNFAPVAGSAAVTVPVIPEFREAASAHALTASRVLPAISVRPDIMVQVVHSVPAMATAMGMAAATTALTVKVSAPARRALARPIAVSAPRAILDPPAHSVRAVAIVTDTASVTTASTEPASAHVPVVSAVQVAQPAGVDSSDLPAPNVQEVVTVAGMERVATESQAPVPAAAWSALPALIAAPVQADISALRARNVRVMEIATGTAPVVRACQAPASVSAPAVILGSPVRLLLSQPLSLAMVLARRRQPAAIKHLPLTAPEHPETRSA